MIEAERKRPDGIDFVVIATPNHLHLPIAKAALEAGIPVMSDKPATATYEEALELEAAVREIGTAVWVDAYLCRLCDGARGARIVRGGQAGHDSQGCGGVFSGMDEQADRDHRAQAGGVARRSCANGPGGAIGDIGTHAFHLLEYVSGLQGDGASMPRCARVVPGRRLDDDCNAFVRLSNGAAGTLACSQVAAGELNEMRLRIYGEMDRSIGGSRIRTG